MTGPLYLLSGASLYFDSLERGFRLAAEVGFDGLEFSPTPAGVRATPSRLHALAQAHGLQLASLHPATVPLPGWGFSPQALRRLARFAAELPGCRFIVLHTPASGRAPVERFFRRLDALQEALAGTAVTVALENRNRRPGEMLARFDSPEDWAALCRERGCGAVLDTAHASTLPVPLLEVYRAVREQLVNIHLSDVVSLGWWGRFSYPRSTLGHHRPPGQGLLPLRELLGELGRDGYAGLITLELSPLALHFWNRRTCRRLLQESLQRCRRWFGTG